MRTSSWYATRDHILRRLRYANYQEYLASDRWKKIRARVMKRCQGQCEVCRNSRATEVHHRSYTWGTLVGKRLDFLVACCRSCHEKAEFDGDRKTKPKEANRRMGEAARTAGFALPGICRICRVNPTGRKGKNPLCGKCKRELQGT